MEKSTERIIVEEVVSHYGKTALNTPKHREMLKTILLVKKIVNRILLDGKS